ncbi:MAG TPA: class I SAM-dependent methyltransferase [Gemmatimonadaceae bacterium]|nr:class I SAM-dependent methyltransferase [Gemmatimonadaceae bacterium]
MMPSDESVTLALSAVHATRALRRTSGTPRNPRVLQWALDLVKQIPIDLGQHAVAERTKGKQIAMGLVPPGEGRTALDAGCREGHQTRWLRRRGYNVTSIDIEPLMPGAVIVDLMRPVPFADGAFDLIWCSEVIEHLPNPACAIAELRRVTRPGGDLIFTTPNSYALLFRLLALVGLTPQRIQRADHRQFFDEPAIRQLFPDAHVYGYFPYALIKRTIRRGVGALSPTFVLHVKKAR